MHKLFETHRRTWVQAIFVLLSGMIVLGSPQDAHAAGRVIWKSTTLKERTKNESWYLEMEIHLGSPPAVSSKSMKFEFTQIVEFERSLEDGREEPVLREIPLTNQQSLIESQLVGFMDPGTGQIQARTRFSFKVTRAHGYRAGKWKVKIKDGDTGSQIGTVSTLVFQGENPVVDRRSMVFQANDGKKKKEKAPEASEDQDTEESTQSADAATDESTESAPEPSDEGQVPPSIEEKPGGGCHHSSSGHPADWAWLGFALGAMGLFVARRRTP